MLRKGSSVSNITGINSNSSNTPGLISSSSATSSPHHYHRRHHDGTHYRSSSASGRESLAQQQTPPHRASYYHHSRTSTPPSSSAILEGAVTSTPLRRGNHLSHSTSTSDIISPSILGVSTTLPTGDSRGYNNILRSPSRHSQQQHHHQQHCCGCTCSNGSGNNTSTKLQTDPINSPSSSTLLRHVVSATLPNSCTPRAHSPQNHQPLVLHPSTTSHNHSTAQLLCSGDCHPDSHPRLTTTTHLNPNNCSGSNSKIWTFGKDEEDDEYCAQDDEDDDRRDRGVPVTRRRRLISASTATSGTGVGTSSHGYSHTVPLLPSPVIAGATVSCSGGGTGCTQYNAGANTSTPVSTVHTPGFNNTALFKLQNSSSSSSVVASQPDLLLPMDFIQVLIHQHAKTIVALQDLQREVSTLKDFRTSLLHSLPASGAPPTASASSGLSEAVWTTGGASGPVGGGPVPAVTANSSPSSSGAGASSAPKIPHPDSGFSTETKSTNQKSDAESEDELYSLLSLIQCKVQESIIRNDFLSSHQSKAPTTTGDLSTTRSGRKSDTSKPKERLGKLDKVLGNCDKVEFRKDFISRDVIRGVLSAEKTELQRQLFFALVKIENLKSLSKEQKTIDSRVYALSQENEQLRYKLKEMEIELEGTKATLRILQKNSFSPSLASRSSSTSTVLPEALSRPAATSNHHHLQHVHQAHNPSSRLIPQSPMWETDSLDVPDPTDFAIPGATPSTVVSTSTAIASSPSASTTTRQRLIQKLSDIETINNSSSGHPLTNNSTRLSTNNNYSYSSSGNHSSSSSKKSPAPKPPVIIEHAVSNSSSSPPSSNNNNNTIPSKQQKSASPVGNKSMSSIKSNNSSIPIAVSRLKQSKASSGAAANSSSSSTANNKQHTGKGKATTGGGGGGGGASSTPSGANPGHIENGGNGTFWANWFRS